jgi:hypothetical protein
MLLQNVPLIFLEVCDALGLVDLASLCAVGLCVALLPLSGCADCKAVAHSRASVCRGLSRVGVAFVVALA